MTDKELKFIDFCDSLMDTTTDIDMWRNAFADAKTEDDKANFLENLNNAHREQRLVTRGFMRWFREQV